MSVSSSTAIFVLSLLAIPMCYVVNTAQTLHGERGLLVSGVSCLLVICFLTYLVIGRKGQARDPLFYVFTICSFGGVASLIIALEGDGHIKGFMSNYLRDGEPYLKTAHGVMISYWDGIGHYSMILMMLAAMAWNQSFREVGLYWAGSIGHSMMVFIPGNVIGKYGLRWSFLLNVPYMFIPFLGAARFLGERPQETVSQQQAQKHHKSIVSRPLDLLLVLSMVVSICLAILRGFAVIGCGHSLFTNYIKDYEPYLLDPVAYPKVQMLVYLFYFVPFYIMAIYGLLYPGNGWLPDWAVIHAGAAAQAQVAHIGGSLHYRTPYPLRVPDDARMIFYLINGALLLVVPQLLAYRCVHRPGFFRPVKDKTE